MDKDNSCSLSYGSPVCRGDILLGRGNTYYRVEGTIKDQGICLMGLGNNNAFICKAEDIEREFKPVFTDAAGISVHPDERIKHTILQQLGIWEISVFLVDRQYGPYAVLRNGQRCLKIPAEELRLFKKV